MKILETRLRLQLADLMIEDVHFMANNFRRRLVDLASLELRPDSIAELGLYCRELGLHVRPPVMPDVDDVPPSRKQD